MSETSDRYLRALRDLQAVVEMVEGDQWEAQSPCEEWKAVDVVGHSVGSLRMVSTLATTGKLAMQYSEWPSSRVLAGDDPKAVFATALETTARDLTPENLAKVVDGPTGRVPLDQFLPACILDVSVHTWDLSQAIGYDVQLDPELVHALLDGVKPFDAMLRQPLLYAAKVEPPEGADEQTQLMAFLGRKV